MCGCSVSRSSNNRINYLHEQALKIVCNEDFLGKDNSVSIYHLNTRLVAIEPYKAKNNLSSKLMLELFQRREVNYNICSQTDFSLRSVNTNSYGLKSLTYLAPKIWNLVTHNINLQPAFLNLLERLSRGYLMVVLVFFVGQVRYIN